ncbi:MAG: PAS domain-containing sensor histidine kinase, partial [Anaerolineae bacterium]|nr:PAS domain-containing sensor histidine kinase [Anaerolineae bacterium]
VWRLILDNSPNAVALINLERGIYYINPAAEALLGYSLEEISHMQPDELAELVHPEDLPTLREKLNGHLQALELLEQLEFRLRLKDGGTAWFEIRCAPIRMTGDVLQIICIVRNIEAEKQVQAANVNNEAKFSAIFEHTQDAILLSNNDAIYTDVNPAACEMLGYTREELIGKTVWDLTPAEHQDAGKQAWDDFAVVGNLSGYYPLLCKDGRQIIVDYRAVYDILPGMHFSVLRDVTEHIQLEENFRTNEARLRSLLESQTAYVVRINDEGHFTYANQRYLEHYGWLIPPDGLNHLNVSATVYPEDIPAMMAAGGQAITNRGKPVQVVLRKPAPEGNYRWTLWEFVALDTVREIQCIGFDITELHHAQEQINLQNTALEAAANAIAIIDRESVVVWVNPAFTTLTGYSRDEAIGQRIGDLQRSPQQAPEFYKNLWETILAGESWSGTLENRRKDGSTYIEEQMITPVRDGHDNITHFIAVKQDVSQRERNEKMQQDYERLKDSFAKERKQNALVQQIISALSHDLRTPLSVIQSSKDKIQRYYPRMTDEQRTQAMDAIDRQVKFTVDLLEDTVQLARGELTEREFQPRPLNLSILCQVSVDEIASTTTIHDLRFENLATFEAVLVDELLVSRILLNLLSNALKYSPDGGEIRLELDEREDCWIVLRVIDFGLGIRKEDLENIFNPFFRSPDVHAIQGTGLGLSIVKDCVERHNGRIHVESELGKGSTFIVELPLSVQ